MDGGVLTGQSLGHFLVLDRLGEGGMGVVYSARDTRLGRTVALKVMRPGALVSDDDTRQRFFQEARAASHLNHPGIVTVYEVDAAAGVDFIAMEYVPGPTLAEAIPSGGLAVERALRLVLQLLEALAAAHRSGIVHRDLKPSNILLAPNDRVKVADFGLAKFSQPSSDSVVTGPGLTAAGVVLGTAAYMSPEQASGQAVDARSDLFSVGCLLYEMLTGCRPFERNSPMDTIAAVLRDNPPPLLRVPRQIGLLVERCLQKEPAKRFQSATDAIAAAEECLAVVAASVGRASIAVLPFVNMSGTREDDYLCEGLSEEIINVLTDLPGLSVIARTSAFAVARLGLDACEIGIRLGVSTILEGSVRRAGRRVRVTAQLIETARGAHLWSERYERELTDIFALEDEIAAAIAARLRGELAHARRERAVQTVVPEAHLAYLEGRYHFARGSAEALALARDGYTRALAADPDFAVAHESLAELHFFTGFYGTVPPREAFARSAWHAARAIELDDGLAEAHAMLGNLRKELDYDWAEVHREFSRALALSPSSPVVRLRRAISALMPLGRVDEALAELEDVLRADPLSLWIRFWVGVLCMLARQPGRALAEGRRMIELDASHPLGHWVLGMGYEESGQCTEALAALKRADELSGGLALTAAFLAYVHGRLGQRAQARSFVSLARGTETYVAPSVAAFACIGLGEWDEAFDWLDRAVDTRDPLIVPIKSYPILDPIRHDPRFAALLRKMHLA